MIILACLLAFTATVLLNYLKFAYKNKILADENYSYA